MNDLFIQGLTIDWNRVCLLYTSRHYIGNVPMNTLFQRLAEEEIRKTAESYLAAG